MLSSPLIVFLNTYGVILLLVCTLAYIWFYERKREETAHIIFACLIALIVALVLKNSFGHPRPFLLDGTEPLAGQVTTESFPSLHTTLAFSLATTVALHQKRVGALLLVLAGLIGMGRVAANVHYPLDIVGGAILGSLVSLVTEKIHLTV